MATVCILYGVGEGRRTGRRLQGALAADGFELIADPKRADIIIAHSGGSLLIPAKVRARQIIQVGPYWPGQPWFIATIRKLANDWRTHRKHGDLAFWFYKTFWNTVYIWNIPAIVRMLRGLKKGSGLRHGGITTIVRPRFDYYCSAGNIPKFAVEPAFLSFAGHHDDIWRDPGPYLALLKRG